MPVLQHLIDQSGNLLIAIPAALTILLSREWYCVRMTGEREVDILQRFSLLSFAGLSLNGIAPGGLLRESPSPALRFMHGQIWLIVLILVSVIYALIKSPAPASFSARFPLALITQSWAMLLINFVPAPPFDAATTYFSSFMQWRFFSVVVMALSAVSFVIFTYGFWRTDFFTGRFIGQWLHLI